MSRPRNKRDSQGRFAHKQKTHGLMRSLSIPAGQGVLVKNLETDRNKNFDVSVSVPKEAIDFFIPHHDWLRWSDVMRQPINEESWYLIGTTAPWDLSGVKSLESYEEAIRWINEFRPWPAAAGLCAVLIDPNTVARWLADHPAEV